MPDKVRKMAYIIGLLAVSSVYWPIGGNTSQAIHLHMRLSIVYVYYIYGHLCFLSLSRSHALSRRCYTPPSRDKLFTLLIKREVFALC